MLTTYFRSSSINTHSFCEQKYFISYVLGMPEDPNKKAEKGTIVHKVCECLALETEAKQKGKTFFVDEALGQLDVDQDVAHLLDMAFDHYSQKSPNLFDEKDRKECLKWCNKALEYQDGLYDPRNRKIIAAETMFDFPINKPWASYKMGETEGQLRIKGTIDLIAESSPGVLEIIDWKTGKRLDWATGEVKTYKKLRDDLQLRLYHYAASQLFPEYKVILVSIFFINDGGVFTVPFSKHDLPIFEKRLREKYERVRDCQNPELSVSWKCTKLCHFGKNLYPGTKDTICNHIKKRVNKDGIELVTLECTDKNHNIDKYNAPGE